jgi:hypothetical protein
MLGRSAVLAWDIPRAEVSKLLYVMAPLKLFINFSLSPSRTSANRFDKI